MSAETGAEKNLGEFNPWERGWGTAAGGSTAQSPLLLPEDAPQQGSDAQQMMAEGLSSITAGSEVSRGLGLEQVQGLWLQLGPAGPSIADL